MKISVNKAHFPVTVLGPGRRIGLWLQGCSIGCKGCVSQDTWARDAGRDMPLAQLLSWCRQAAADGFDGVTITGGEPFDQPAALSALLSGLHRWRTQAGLDFDLLCYSGYPLARLQHQHSAVLAQLDALIPEPFVHNQPITHVWRGSSNQPLVCLTQRGRERYAGYEQALVQDHAKRIQTMVDGDRLWTAGIPARGDMAALEQSCLARGIRLEQMSWSP